MKEEKKGLCWLHVYLNARGPKLSTRNGLPKLKKESRWAGSRYPVHSILSPPEPQVMAPADQYFFCFCILPFGPPFSCAFSRDIQAEARSPASLQDQIQTAKHARAREYTEPEYDVP
jgi:hypothetical protein